MGQSADPNRDWNVNSRTTDTAVGAGIDWKPEGKPYTGSGHDSWTHVSIHRSTALEDHGILIGWTATAGP